MKTNDRGPMKPAIIVNMELILSNLEKANKRIKKLEALTEKLEDALWDSDLTANEVKNLLRKAEKEAGAA